MYNQHVISTLNFALSWQTFLKNRLKGWTGMIKGTTNINIDVILSL